MREEMYEIRQSYRETRWNSCNGLEDWISWRRHHLKSVHLACQWYSLFLCLSAVYNSWHRSSIDLGSWCGGKFDGDLIYLKACPYIYTAVCVYVSCTHCSDLPIFIVETHDSNNARWASSLSASFLRLPPEWRSFTLVALTCNWSDRPSVLQPRSESLCCLERFSVIKWSPCKASGNLFTHSLVSIFSLQRCYILTGI